MGREDSKVEIPIEGGRSVVELTINELPPDVDTVIELLETEMTPLKIWLRVALLYYRKGDRKSFKRLLDMCTDESVVENHYRSDLQGQADVFSSFGSFKLEQVKQLNSEESTIKERKEELIQEATALYEKAEVVDDSLVFIHRAFLHLAKKDSKRAEATFREAMKSESENIVAQIGLANLLLQKGDREPRVLEEALRYYSKALQGCPSAPADIRLCLALIFQRLNLIEKAREAYERVLDLDANSVEARLGLALLDLNGREDLPFDEKDVVQRALRLLEDAFFLDPFHPMVLVHLANHYFMSKSEKGRRLSLSFALKAYETAKSNKVKSEARYMSGRVMYVSGQVDDASEHFREAIQLWPEFPLALHGLGQCLISGGEIGQAVAVFEKLHRLVPDSIYVIKALGTLHSNVGDKSSALKMLRRAVELDPADPYSLMLLGEKLQSEASDVKLLEALRFMEKAIELFKCEIRLWNSLPDIVRYLSPTFSANDEPPLEVLNSIGVLHNRLGNLNEALRFFTELERRMDKTTDLSPSVAVTFRYNHAIALEENGQTEAAILKHQDILKKDPKYIDSDLRLAHVLARRGAFSQAETFLEDAMKIDSKNAYVLAMKSNVSIAQGDWKNGQALLEEVIKLDKNNKFANLNFAYINFLNAQDEKHWKRAFEYYLRILQKEPSNITAATGIAMCLAERGRLEESRKILDDIVDAKTNIESVWLNLAHIYSMMGKHDRAVKQYKKCLNIAVNKNDVRLLLYSARALFLDNQLKESRRMLAKALLVDPESVALWFNYGRVIFQDSTNTAKDLRKVLEYQKRREPLDIARQRLDQSMRCLNDMEMARKIFSTLTHSSIVRRTMPSSHSIGSLHGFTASMAKDMLKRSMENLKGLPTFVKAAQSLYDFNASKVAEEEQRRVQLEEERRRQEEERERETQLNEELRFKQFQENESKFKELMEKMPEPPPAQQRKRKAAAEDMEFIVDDEFIESEKRKKQTQLVEKSGALSYERNGSNAKPKRLKKAGLDSDSDEEEQMQSDSEERTEENKQQTTESSATSEKNERPTAKAGKHTLAKAGLDSESEEEEDED